MIMLFRIPHLNFVFSIFTLINNTVCKEIMRISWPEQHDRIVTDLEDVFRGVPVDFRYNESDSSSAVISNDGFLSVPGCPKSVDGYPWVYYGSPVRCYLAGVQGPCGPDQKLFIEARSPYGICICDCFEGTKKNRNSSEEFCTLMSDNRECAFLVEKKRSYLLYEQGPCKRHEWLAKSVKNSKNVTICEKRKCPHGQIPYETEIDKLHSSTTSDFSCFSPISPFAGPVSIIPHDCESDGMKYSKLLKKCVKKFAFNFG